MSDQLRVLSFNCWGLKFVSKDRNERIAAIAQRLSQSDHDIIALQELWVYKDYLLIKASVEKVLPYAKFFHSGALGSGLALFSRFPIVEASIHPYSLNGAPIDVVAGDWFVGKAAASIVIVLPILGEVQIFNTHLFAKGGEDGPDHQRAHRLVNAWEFSKLVKQAAKLGRYVIAAGDFNSIPTTLPMTIIRDYTNLSDCWSVTHRGANLATPPTASTPLDAVTRFGITADSPLNTYSAEKPLDPHARKYLGKRLDYIFYRQPFRSGSRSDQDLNPVLTCKECKVVFTDRVPNYEFSFSDHFGLEATLEFSAPEDEDWAATGAFASSSPGSQLSRSLSIASITDTILALNSCYQFSRYRSHRELTIFGICLLFLLALVVGSVWIPYPWINPIFVLVTIFVSWFATTMFYEGFLYGNWERNALTNTLEDLEIYKKSVELRRDS